MLLKLILEQYIPLLKSGIQKVELTTPHMINLFISTNGSGKTSILKEMNPLPPENGNYEAGGRKYVEIQIGDRHFALDSYTGKGNGHSFKLNGKELNPNGTGASQKELVSSYFRLDSTLNKVLSGLRVVDLLSLMSPGKRKEIFMQIYPNDTDYALGVWTKLKNERNELKAAIKNQIARYTEENRKLAEINEYGIDELEVRIKTIEGELRDSLLVRGGLEGITVDRDLTVKIQDFNRLVDQLTTNKLSGIIYTQPEVAQAINFTTELMNRHQEQAGVLKRVIAEHAGVLDGLEEFLADPEVFQVQADHIREDLAKLEQELAQYAVLLQQYPVFNDPEIPLGNLELVITGFREFLGRITVVSDPAVNGATYKGWLTLQDQLANELRHTTMSLDDMTHKLTHYEKAETVECPDCEHAFKIGITPAEIEHLKQQKAALVAKVERLRKEEADVKRQIENDADWYLGMNQLFVFVRENNHCGILPTLIKEYDIGKTDSNRLLNALLAFSERFSLLAKKDELLMEQNVLDTRLGLLDRNNALDVAHYLASVEKELLVENNQITHYKERLESLKRTQHHIVSYSRDVNRLHGLREEIMIGLGNQGKAEFRKKVDERISILSEEKDHYMTSIIKNRSLTAVVNSISGDIERLKRRLLIVDIYMDGLCPNKGLIGRLMGDFIKAVCTNMNALFKTIYAKPLVIKPCSKENGDLTYKFPVIVGDASPTPDVTDCSAGERDLIDWAFRFVMLSYHPVEYPLLMDEVGVNLDEINRGRFFSFVQEYTRQKSPRQLFMVSHYVNQYGLFNKPNVIAMRYEGLTLTGEVNQDSIIA
jgi:energy-coupling factor transporter ATP-binding protein EcfA2